MEAFETPLQQSTRNPLMAMAWINGQVVKVAAPSVMATQHRGDYFSVC